MSKFGMAASAAAGILLVVGVVLLLDATPEHAAEEVFGNNLLKAQAKKLNDAREVVSEQRGMASVDVMLEGFTHQDDFSEITDTLKKMAPKKDDLEQAITPDMDGIVHFNAAPKKATSILSKFAPEEDEEIMFVQGQDDWSAENSAEDMEKDDGDGLSGETVLSAVDVKVKTQNYEDAGTFTADDELELDLVQRPSTDNMELLKLSEDDVERKINAAVDSALYNVRHHKDAELTEVESDSATATGSAKVPVVPPVHKKAPQDVPPVPAIPGLTVYGPAGSGFDGVPMGFPAGSGSGKKMHDMKYCDEDGCCSHDPSGAYCKKKHPHAKECPPPAGKPCGTPDPCSDDCPARCEVCGPVCGDLDLAFGSKCKACAKKNNCRACRKCQIKHAPAPPGVPKPTKLLRKNAGFLKAYAQTVADIASDHLGMKGLGVLGQLIVRMAEVGKSSPGVQYEEVMQGLMKANPHGLPGYILKHANKAMLTSTGIVVMGPVPGKAGSFCYINYQALGLHNSYPILLKMHTRASELVKALGKNNDLDALKHKKPLHFSVGDFNKLFKPSCVGLNGYDAKCESLSKMACNTNARKSQCQFVAGWDGQEMDLIMDTGATY
jgi:hypothetical protein